MRTQRTAAAAVAGTTLLYAAILHYSVQQVISPLFPYLPYRAPDPALYVLIIGLAVLTSLVLPRRLNKPSDTAQWILQVSAGLPTMLCSQYLNILNQPDSFLLGIHVALATCLVRGVCVVLPTARFGQRLSSFGRYFWVGLMGYAVVIYAVLFLVVGARLRFNGLLDVYGIRADFEAQAAAVPGLGYALPVLYNVVNPLLAARGLFARKWSLVAFGAGGQILLFLAAGQKSVFFSTLFLVGLAVLYRRGRVPAASLLLNVISAGSLAALAADRLTGTVYASSVFIRRFLVLPGALATAYVSIFSHFPQTHFADSFLRFLGDPYASGPAPTHLVGRLYIGDAESSANVSYFGHGFLSAGYFGIYVEALVLGLLLWVIDQAAWGLPAKLGALIIVMPSIALSSASIFTAMLSHGMVGLVLILLMAPRDGWSPTGRATAWADPQSADD